MKNKSDKVKSDGPLHQCKARENGELNTRQRNQPFSRVVEVETIMERMDGWMDGWKEGWMDGRMDGGMEGRMEGRKEGVRKEGRKEGRKEKGKIERWMDGRQVGVGLGQDTVGLTWTYTFCIKTQYII